MARDLQKQLKDLIRLAESQGWRVEYRGSGHYSFRHPDGKTQIFCSSTSVDRRGFLNHIKRLQRAGLQIDR